MMLGAHVTESQPPIARTSSLRPALFIFVLCAAVVAVVGVSKWRTKAELVPWQKDFAAAQAQARTANKPVLLYFTAEWCGPCQEMRRSVWSDATVAAAASSYIPVRIDVDEQPDLARRYRVETIPAFFILDPAGSPLKSIDHAMEAEETLAWLRR
jgi:protein disulfide-isomerase